MPENVIPKKLTGRMVRSYIDFDGHAATVSADQPSNQAALQSEGVAGLWGLLQQKGFAYLADEVGMGKTRQAMGVIATQFLSKANSRVVIVCSSIALQRQWQTEWSQFLSKCYKLLDDRLLGTAGATQLLELRMHQNLREFAAALKDDDTRIHLLRYSSFSRPLTMDKNTPHGMLKDYLNILGIEDAAHLSEKECEIVERYAGKPQGWSDDMRYALAAQYCARVAALLTDGPAVAGNGSEVEPVTPLDLVVFDEAQYLRHIGNKQNEHLRRIFRRNVQKWLFLSATPLHSGSDDIKSLDAYLSQQPVKAAAESQPGWDVVNLLQQMMIRRTRTYADHSGRRYGKVEYRQYDRVRHSGADDPFLAMTMALVQKRLVGALAGHGNKFRQGECASFESLSSSVARSIGPVRRKAVATDEHPEFEPAKDHRQTDPSGNAIDRTVIDELNHSFVQAMPQALGYGLPHAKLHGMADLLFERSLAQGSIDKTLVFVRRIDTVEEIRDLLHVRFQGEVDKRIAAWHELLSAPEMATQSKHWTGSFWDVESDGHGAAGLEGEGDEVEDGDSDSATGNDNDDDDAPHTGPATHNHAYREQPKLAYFEALKKRSATHEQNGKLVSFRSRLHGHVDLMDKPLRGFLHRRPEQDADDAAWRLNKQRWQRFLRAVMGEQEFSALQSVDWRLGDPAGASEESFKLAALQLCLLQSMRQTDLVVDLYILHSHLGSTPDGAKDLPDKLLWFLEQQGEALPAGLARYVANQRARFRHWIDHFDLIVDKCFRGGRVISWKDVWSERIGEVFRPLAPVIGRSGRLRSRHAIAHFNLPTHPNILVCTDVLKEGVDMHLFCDSVVQFGVAWTSGDLEQRIGRVDRFGSLISRRIGAHMQHEGRAPRMEVVFPYLEGTLDQHQVNRVIRAKLASDQRMDLGKRKDEIGEIRIDALESADANVEQGSNVAVKDGAVFFPPSVAFVRDGGGDLVLPSGIVRKGAADQVTPCRQIDKLDAETLSPLPAAGALVVRRALEEGHDILRLASTGGANVALVWTEEFVVLRGVASHPSLADVLANGGPHAVTHPPVRSFAFDADLNTCVWCPGNAQVLLEAIGQDFWLLRSFVRIGTDQVAERNRHRTAGYLMDADGAVWFAAVVQRSQGAELALLEHMAQRVNRVAGNLRQPGVEVGAHGYRSRAAFPAPTGQLWMNTMKQSDVVACGQVLSGVQVWFKEAFESVLLELYDGVQPDERPLKTNELTFLPDGTLHLSTEGAERFRLQAGLDLAGAMERPFAGPKMWWELVATPRARGPVPELPVSEVDELPHADSSYWEGEDRALAAAFTSTGERDYRHAALYHAPQDWERSRVSLIAAFEAVRRKMHELENFQRKGSRDLLLDALKD
jgi:hypothetical protein